MVGKTGLLAVIWESQYTVLNFPYLVSYVNLSIEQPMYGLVFCSVCITCVLWSLMDSAWTQSHDLIQASVDSSRTDSSRHFWTLLDSSIVMTHPDPWWLRLTRYDSWLTWPVPLMYIYWAGMLSNLKTLPPVSLCVLTGLSLEFTLGIVSLFAFSHY